MKYSVEYTVQAARNIRKLDKHTRKLILSWIEKNLIGCENPRRFGKGLTANRSGQWRYRIGNYRLIAQIDDGKVTILILNAGHRKYIYEN